MTDSLLIPWSGRRITNASGTPQSGALVYVYLEDTLTLADLFSDRDLLNVLANPVTCDSGGLVPQIYIGTTPYKIKITTSAGATIDEQDDLPGALNTAPFSAAAYAKPDTDFSAKTTDYVVTADDLGTVINVNTTSATVNITLLSAVTATNGRGITIRHIGTGNQVKIVASGAETITHPATGVTTTAFSLVGYGEAVEIVSDGANWHVTSSVPPFMRPNTPGVIIVADRVTSAPVSPNPGARYIVSGAFSTFEQEDIIEATGQGGFIEFTPPTDCGWVAYVQDEDAFYAFVGSAWVEEAATQTLMEAAASVARFSTPGRQHYHPAHFKSVVNFNGSGVVAIRSDFGVSSITDGGTGLYTVNFDVAFSDTNYGLASWARGGVNADGNCSSADGTSKTTTAIAVGITNSAASLFDSTEIGIGFFGDQ